MLHDKLPSHLNHAAVPEHAEMIASDWPDLMLPVGHHVWSCLPPQVLKPEKQASLA